MRQTYDHRSIEEKWQERWEKKRVFATPTALKNPKDKWYVLDMFPYPSGSGLHVGHLLGYTGADVLARVARMQGKQVLHPMGWDAFGLPAENFAIKQGKHPAETTAANIAEFKRQFRQTGISYDWDREINTSDPAYYKWTQWLFTVLYQRNLAYRKNGLVNWCPTCQTVLANEQVITGACERCGSLVVQRELMQWYFKITDYADRLLAGLDRIEWPEKIKTMQRNWIGRSEGAQLFFTVEGFSEKIEVYTTRPETVYGATFLVLAPEHPLVPLITSSVHRAEVEKYQKEAARKNELERSYLDKEKTGVFTGAFALNPATHAQIPIWVADYVLSGYGAGAIMAVPAHDERDFAFAQAFHLPVVSVLETGGQALPFVEKAPMAVPGPFAGKLPEECMDALLKEIGGTRQVRYRLRDWLVSRQRYWGAPIPVAYDEADQEYLLPEEELPVTLPEEVEFRPNGQSPLQYAEAWKQYRDPRSGKELRREVDTLDTFVCSSWYFLRYISPRNDRAAFDKDAVRQWLPVDHYVGGAEHAVLHLLYARFITKVLYDAGYLTFDEPFQRLSSVGIILGPDHNKMSKSKGNVINPDEVITQYGADTLRMYELFMAPFDLEKPWDTQGIIGIRRFLEKFWRLREKVRDEAASPEESQILHRLTKKVTEDVADLRFNTAIAAMMEAVNQWSDQEGVSEHTFRTAIVLLNPFAPHLTEELWEAAGGDGFCSVTQWPTYDPALVKEETREYAVQINGKVRAKLTLPSDLEEKALLQAVYANTNVQRYLKDSRVLKEVVVPGRLVSLVIREKTG
jgi:leucyl-tRNA synthetase